jgi:SAM-dependent methyltransferase
MSALEDRGDVKARAKKAYEILEEIWPETDAWSTHTRRNITKIVETVIDKNHLRILNAGCGNNDYGLSSRAECINLDISARQCREIKRAIVADVESIPFRNESFDATICVGAVLNYVEPYEAIPELARVTKRGGLILIDFETTSTAELVLSKAWGKRVSVIERNYAGHSDKTFLFSVGYIKTILEQYDVEITATHYYHLTTAIWHRIFSSVKLPAMAFSIDEWACRVPCLRHISSNVIFVCRKD